MITLIKKISLSLSQCLYSDRATGKRAYYPGKEPQSLLLVRII